VPLIPGLAEQRASPQKPSAAPAPSDSIPFGSVLGVMYNPHYLEIVRSGGPV
jgi:hypothetical protein